MASLLFAASRTTRAELCSRFHLITERQQWTHRIWQLCVDLSVYIFMNIKKMPLHFYLIVKTLFKELTTKNDKMLFKFYVLLWTYWQFLPHTKNICMLMQVAKKGYASIWNHWSYCKHFNIYRNSCSNIVFSFDGEAVCRRLRWGSIAPKGFVVRYGVCFLCSEIGQKSNRVNYVYR